MLKLKIPQEKCYVCRRGAKVGNNRPNSLHATKRLFGVNLVATQNPQTGKRVKICARCLRSQSKQKTKKSR